MAECGGKVVITYQVLDLPPVDITHHGIRSRGMTQTKIPDPERACRMGDCKGGPDDRCQAL